jgi:hypothetical protein
MQTMGPMMSRMMQNGDSGGFAADPRDRRPVRQGYSGGGDFSAMLGGSGGSDLMGMIPQLMRMANIAGGPRRNQRRHR